MSKRKPKTQSGFSMHELAGLIAMPLPTVVFKPKQDDKKRMDMDEPIKPKQKDDI
tara:strand:+ start:299 stop:463 length:165 start_codon:yes stop_codon:yes gene_type:complete